MDGNLPLHRASTDGATLSTGRVVAVDGDALTLALGRRELPARRATGCLVEPQPGDLVLAAEAGGETYVLSVLDRTDGGSAVLSVPRAEAATLAQATLALRCEELTVDAVSTTLRSRAAQVAGSVLSAVAERLDVVARTLRRSADHEFSHAKTATRTVDGAETVSAGEVMLQARNAIAQRGGIVLIDAREDVRVNGERITMG